MIAVDALARTQVMVSVFLTCRAVSIECTYANCGLRLGGTQSHFERKFAENVMSPAGSFPYG